MAAGDKGNAALATAVTATGVQSAYNLGDGKIRPQVNVQVLQTLVPTTASITLVETSVDGTNYSELGRRITPLAAGTYSWTLFPGDASTHVRTSFTQQVGPTGSSSTLNAQIGYVTTA